MKFRTAFWANVVFVAITVSSTACGLLGRKPEPAPVLTAMYQPFSAVYRGVSQSRVSQHFDDQATETDFAFEYFLRADVIPGDEAFYATLVLDSVVLFEEARAGVSDAQLASVQGAVFRANVSRNGRLTDFVAEDSLGSFARELADRLLRPLLPILPSQGVEAGTSWADTVQTQIIMAGLDNSVRSINDHFATEWVDHASVRALHIRTVSEYTFSGEGIQAGQTFTLDGTGRRHTHRYIGEDGRYLGMVSADTSDGEARLTELDLVVPIHQTRIDSLTIGN